MCENIPRSEFPDPQFERKEWKNLNGKWQFEIDRGKSGFDRGFSQRDSFDCEITVPFCPESEFSGIGNTDFMSCVWYMRSFEIDQKWLENDRFVILHIGACDYETHVYINKKPVGIHKGGYSSFKFDITKFLTAGENTITIAAIDDTRSRMQGTGKQSTHYHSGGCLYTRVTGIWQTVWLESVEKRHIEEIKIYTNAKEGIATVCGKANGIGKVKGEAFFEGTKMGEAEAEIASGHFVLNIKVTEKHLWDVGKGNLYDLILTYCDDEVKSYFGLRDIHFDGMKFMLNGRSLFQRTVLDQGYYPDGIYTAPSDDALAHDIKISMAAGFNGARLHQKVFEPRFLYHCDRLGYLVWGEYGDWGIDYSDANILTDFVPEWLEILKRDFNHPSLVGWCPFNETWDYEGWKRANGGVFRTVYYVTKAFDETRPVIDTSGGYHVITDIYDHHDYEQNPDILKANYDKLTTNGYPVLEQRYMGREKYEGQPFFMSEYGGLRLTDSDKSKGWGYGETSNAIDFNNKYKALTDALLGNPSIFGFCYTQLYDVEQEKNGLYFYDRSPKADIDFISEVNSQRAAIEDQDQD